MPGLGPWLSPGSAWGESPVPVCATATRARGQPTAAFAHGRVLAPRVLCGLALSNDQQEAAAGWLGSILAFISGLLLRLAQSICLVPLESRHRPQVIFLLKHSRKARAFFKD